MIIFLGSRPAADAHLRERGINPRGRGVIVATTWHALRGYRLQPEDKVLFCPTFREVRDSTEILADLRMLAEVSGINLDDIWEDVGCR